jgi:hypothetical protein
MSRFYSELDLVSSIKSLAMRATTVAVDSTIEASRADLEGDRAAAAEHVRRLTTDTAVATADIAWFAAELDASTAADALIAAAGAAITGLQSSLLSIAGAVEEIACAEALRTTALQLDELLPSFQPSL